MAWMELHQSLPQNKKTLRLKRLLKIRTPQAVGHLCMLWLWAIDNAPDGDLTPFEPSELAEVCGYEGENPAQFVAALQESGFLDADGCIHDWQSYTGRLLEQRELQREQARLRQQKRREKLRHVTRDDSVSHADTEQDQTEQDRTEPDEDTHTVQSVLPEAVERRFCSAIHAMRPGERETLCRLVEKFSETTVLRAIEEARGRGKSANYLAAMLESGFSNFSGFGMKNGETTKRRPTYDLDELDNMADLLMIPPCN